MNASPQIGKPRATVIDDLSRAHCVLVGPKLFTQAPKQLDSPNMSTPSRIKTRILILSDTHSATPSKNANDVHAAFRPPLPRADVLLHCGDLTMIGLLNEYETTLAMLRDIDADLKLVIAGNHDISLDEAYYARKGQSMQQWRLDEPDPDMPRKARELWTGARAREAGVTYLDEGTHFFALKNGAKLRVRGGAQLNPQLL